MGTETITARANRSGRAAGNHGRVLPDAALLRHLYCVEQESLCEIAVAYGVTQTSVKRRLQFFGVPRRPRRYVGAQHCIVPGCGALARKRWNVTARTFEGRRCEAHWKEHRRRRYERWYDAVNPPRRRPQAGTLAESKWLLKETWALVRGSYRRGRTKVREGTGS